MTEIRKSALVAHSAERIFDLIEAAEHYPAFLPWCAAATILARDEATVSARITIDYHGVRLHLATRNPKRRPDYMAIHLEQGPFRHFEGEWRLARLAEDACRIEFALRYEFENAVTAKLAGLVFDRIANSLVDAFVARADEVYGPTRRAVGGAAAGESP
jgi:ribosome-associated toxin RatA of RatAB toxin-antitoxin module